MKKLDSILFVYKTVCMNLNNAYKKADCALKGAFLRCVWSVWPL